MCPADHEKGERQIRGGIEQLNQKRFRTLGEKGNYKYLEILKADSIKQAKMKEKVRKEYPTRTRKLLKTKLYNKRGENTWSVSFVRSIDDCQSGQGINSDKWIKGTEIDDMHKVLHLIDDIDRLYVSRKGGRKPSNIED